MLLSFQPKKKRGDGLMFALEGRRYDLLRFFFCGVLPYVQLREKKECWAAYEDQNFRGVLSWPKNVMERSLMSALG